MRYLIEIDDLESSLSEREIEKAVDDMLLDISDNYGNEQIYISENEDD